jgi:hypothetical protein
MRLGRVGRVRAGRQYKVEDYAVVSSARRLSLVAGRLHGDGAALISSLRNYLCLAVEIEAAPMAEM